MLCNISRWLTEEGRSGLDKYWIPFGGGARKCMGYNFAILEIKVCSLCISTSAFGQTEMKLFELYDE